MELYSYHDTYVNKDGEQKHINRCYIVDAVRHKYIRIQASFSKFDAKTLAVLSISVNGLDDVIRAAGLEPKAKDPKASAAK